MGLEDIEGGREMNKKLNKSNYLRIVNFVSISFLSKLVIVCLAMYLLLKFPVDNLSKCI